MNSTFNIQKRFNLLFRLPSTAASVMLASASVLSLLIIISTSQQTSLNYRFIGYFLVLFYSSIILERVLLGKHSVANFRRLFAMSIVPNLIWVILVMFGSYKFLANGLTEIFYMMTLMGMFTAIGIRTLIMGSIFFEKIMYGLLASIIQPLVILNSAMPRIEIFNLFSTETLAVSTGVFIPIAAVTYLFMLDRSQGDVLKNSPLKLLRAFLNAWVAERPKLFEDIFEKLSLEKEIDTKIIEFNKKTLLVVPEVHPGPFYPIGSSNLPFELYNYFTKLGAKPVIFHGISGHEYNLPSKRTVEKYISNLDSVKELGTGKKCSVPIITNNGIATITGIAFGEQALILITMSPHGSEDFPKHVKDRINKIALDIGFSGSVIIDSHNSRGLAPENEICESVVKTAKDMLLQLKEREQFSFTVGYSHSSQIKKELKDDIGPGGISCVVLNIEGKPYTIISSDSNNMVKGFRENIMKKNSNVLEICTTDSHYNAAKVMNSLGYKPLGESTSSKEFQNIVDNMFTIAKKKMEKGEYIIQTNKSRVKVLGSALLDDYSFGLDNVFRLAKFGGIFLILINVVVYLLSYRLIT